MIESVKSPASGGACPTNLRASIREASRGGADGYALVGRKMLDQLNGLMPYEMEADAWNAALDDLEARFERNDRMAVLEWFDAIVPRLMALVPVRRRAQLVRGMMEQVDEGEYCFGDHAC